MTSGSAVPSPVTAETVVEREDSLPHNAEPIVPDSGLYIGEIRTFPETDELYTPLFYHEHLNVEGLHESISKQVDSVTYEDSERRRRRVPMATARNYFNLSGLDTISVYKERKLLCRARLVRVEHYEDLIESQFVAVFEALGLSTVPHQPDYCVSTGVNPYKTVDITGEETEDEQLTKDLLQRFASESTRVWSVLHVRMMPYNSIYTAISMQSRLLLIETHDGQSRILKDLKEDWFISDMTPLHLENNGKPILLLTMGLNETDMIWTSLAVFSEEAYIFPDNNRMKVLQ